MAALTGNVLPLQKYFIIRKKMKKILVVLYSIVALVMIASCNDYETYAEQKEKERDAINQFIKDSAINVISEETFRSQGYTTNLSKNEYVLFESSGVYLQILRKGCGAPLKNGETATVLCRFTEKNIFTDSIQATNNILTFSSVVDKMSVTRSSDSYTASFISGESVMSMYYGSSVPSGWLVPLNYINIGRPKDATEETAKVKLIVPHSQGQSYASQNVYPCYYIITYEKGL